MGKVAFLPFSLGSGLLAGVIAKRVFGLVWGMIDDQEPPKPEHRNVRIGKLMAAVAIEGLVFALTRGLVDHGSRRAFERFTGSWPGDEQPESQ
ncbi:MAG TPA: DUF4235 domain-containing protein [Solirubrobacteraceae bacterium]|jgi:hypothetical protein|nr:DUF4235 domain-containing protein [Solirubrobacteraceae bacterium]